MDGKLLRVGALVLLLALLGGCTSNATFRIRSDLPVLTPFVEGMARAHSNIVCSNADVEERWANVSTSEVQGVGGGRRYTAEAGNRCTKTWK